MPTRLVAQIHRGVDFALFFEIDEDTFARIFSFKYFMSEWVEQTYLQIVRLGVNICSSLAATNIHFFFFFFSQSSSTAWRSRNTHKRIKQSHKTCFGAANLLLNNHWKNQNIPAGWLAVWFWYFYGKMLVVLRRSLIWSLERIVYAQFRFQFICQKLWHWEMCIQHFFQVPVWLWGNDIISLRETQLAKSRKERCRQTKTERQRQTDEPAV